MRHFIVPLSFVLCISVIVRSYPLHQLEKRTSDTQNSATDEESIVSFKSSQKKEDPGLNMGGYLSRPGRRAQQQQPSRGETKQEIKQEGNPRLETEAKLDQKNQNKIEVDLLKKRLAESIANVDIPPADDREGESACRSPQCDELLHNKESQPVDIPSSTTTQLEEDEAVISPSEVKIEPAIEVNIDQHEEIRRPRTASLTGGSFEPDLIIVDDASDMAEDILSEIPRLTYDPPESVAVFITGEPIIYHPTPLVDEVIEVQVDVVDDDIDDMKRKRRSSKSQTEVQETEFDQQEPVVNVEMKNERRKRSAGKTTEDQSSSENVIKVRVGMYQHNKKRTKTKRKRSTEM